MLQLVQLCLPMDRALSFITFLLAKIAYWNNIYVAGLEISMYKTIRILLDEISTKMVSVPSHFMLSLLSGRCLMKIRFFLHKIPLIQI
jgi:hypothetical protein